MRFLLKTASLTLFALAFTLGTLGAVATTQAAPVAACPESADLDGNLVCPYARCGFLWLKTCQLIIVVDQNGTPTGDTYCDCR